MYLNSWMLITLREKVNLQRFVLKEATLTVTALHVLLKNYQTMSRRFVKPVNGHTHNKGWSESSAES